jgi:hypothetical protein
LLEFTGHCLCVDPRDKIYDFLGLLTEDTQSDIVIDYSKSLWRVYIDVIHYASRIQEDKHSLARLSYPRPAINYGTIWDVSFRNSITRT